MRRDQGCCISDKNIPITTPGFTILCTLPSAEWLHKLIPLHSGNQPRRYQAVLSVLAPPLLNSSAFVLHNAGQRSTALTMDNLRVIASLLSLVLVGFLTYGFFVWYRLSHIPGPFWPSTSKYWLVQQSLKGQMHSALKDVTDKYGSSICSM